MILSRACPSLGTEERSQLISTAIILSNSALENFLWNGSFFIDINVKNRDLSSHP